MTTPTLADKRCRRDLIALRKAMADIYDKAFHSKVTSDDFWRRVDEIDRSLSRKLEARPINDMEIERACTIALNDFRQECGRELKR